MDKVQQWRAVDEGSNSYWFECLPSVHCLILGGSPPADRQTHTQCFPASWMILPGMDFLLPLCTRDCPCIIKYLFWERKELLYYNIRAQQAGSEQLYWQLNAINNCVVSLRPWFSPSWILFPWAEYKGINFFDTSLAHCRVWDPLFPGEEGGPVQESKTGEMGTIPEWKWAGETPHCLRRLRL